MFQTRWFSLTLLVGLAMTLTGCGGLRDGGSLFSRTKRDKCPVCAQPCSNPYPAGYVGPVYPVSGTPCSCGPTGAPINVTGPILPSANGEILPVPNAVPKIEEGGKQMPWDPNMKSSTKNGTEVKNLRNP